MLKRIPIVNRSKLPVWAKKFTDGMVIALAFNGHKASQKQLQNAIILKTLTKVTNDTIH